MQRLEVSGSIRPLYGSLGVKGLMMAHAQGKLIKLLNKNRPNTWSCICKLPRITSHTSVLAKEMHL